MEQDLLFPRQTNMLGASTSFQNSIRKNAIKVIDLNAEYTDLNAESAVATQAT